MDPSLRTADLDYELPSALVATRPAEPRDQARMLVLRRSDDSIEHRRVADLPGYLDRGTSIVLNDTAVAPARLLGRRAGTGGHVEGLLLGSAGRGRVRVMLRANGRLRPGSTIELLDHAGAPGRGALTLVERADEAWIVRLGTAATDAPTPALDAVGWTPLPPYILHARRDRGESYADGDDRAWYQTVYADASRRESVAAPTAGLHFTPALLGALDACGVSRLQVTLHVGPGTFKPVTAPTLVEHHMHSERYEVPGATIDALRAIRAARAGGERRQLLAVGTTAVRALESLPEPLPPAPAPSINAETDLMIQPPYAFRHVDGMLTNFHLPRSTLLALVAAMVGLERLLAVYREAIRREYRFYSYGDAMLILP